MKLTQIKKEFSLQLKDFYSENEIRTMFYWLAETYLQKSKIELLSEPFLIIEQSKIELFHQALNRLTTFEPIQYILGFSEFCDLKFNVNPSVLIPRPETEELVEWVAEIYQNQSPKIIDIGTGSGCIGISLAKKLSHAEVTVLDVSENVLKVAQENAELNHVDLKFLQKNILEIDSLEEDYQVVVSNPPYVLNEEKSLMKENVLKYEPHLALFVENNNPLIFYHKIARLVKKQAQTCVLFFEINEQYGNQLVKDLAAMGFKEIELKNDFLNKPRMLKAKVH
ncbi:MAG: peptide chain release factor N(5)-glutamine methyltransferase [Flavobacteriaceae bacterium]|nr:peptide chain release factor N(5)-glutamine methyltransferase [Flavobacteriaceae bacterium]